MTQLLDVTAHNLSGSAGSAWPAGWDKDNALTDATLDGAGRGRLVAPVNTGAATPRAIGVNATGMPTQMTSDSEFTCDLAFNRPGSGVIYIGICWALGFTTPTGYFARLNFGTGQLFIDKYTAAAWGSGIHIATLSTLGALWPANDAGPFRIRFKRRGRVLAVKIWKVGTEEPAAWALQAYDDDTAVTLGQGRIVLACASGDVAANATLTLSGTTVADAVLLADDLNGYPQTDSDTVGSYTNFADSHTGRAVPQAAGTLLFEDHWTQGSIDQSTGEYTADPAATNGSPWKAEKWLERLLVAPQGLTAHQDGSGYVWAGAGSTGVRLMDPISGTLTATAEIDALEQVCEFWQPYNETRMDVCLEMRAQNDAFHTGYSFRLVPYQEAQRVMIGMQDSVDVISPTAYWPAAGFRFPLRIQPFTQATASGAAQTTMPVLDASDFKDHHAGGSLVPVDAANPMEVTVGGILNWIVAVDVPAGTITLRNAMSWANGVGVLGPEPHYYLRWRSKGRLLALKVWRAEDPEPVEWTTQFYDIRWPAGRPRLRLESFSSHEIRAAGNRMSIWFNDYTVGNITGGVASSDMASAAGPMAATSETECVMGAAA